jgi:hypothetical protein
LSETSLKWRSLDKINWENNYHRNSSVLSISTIAIMAHMLALSHPKVGELSKKIDAVNPKREATTSKAGPDIFEI